MTTRKIEMEYLTLTFRLLQVLHPVLVLRWGLLEPEGFMAHSATSLLTGPLSRLSRHPGNT